ncbi:hypothetical protein PJP07_29655, partial [Mycobacterium kansasii]
MSNFDSLSVSRPPPFNGSNYAYWKARMRIFLKSLDESVWLATVNEWKPPTTEVTDDDGSKSIKVLTYYLWTTTQKSENSGNAKALNAITCALSPDEFKRIISCENAKQAWDVLEMTHEGTSIVKKSKV